MDIPTFRLDGKRALITGGGRGIGLAGAQALSAAGAHVTLTARSPAEIERAVADIRATGGTADACVIDATDIATMRDMIAGSQPFDILLNNAGTNRIAPFLDATPEDFDVIFATNARATFFVAQAFAKRLIAAKRGGAIVNLSSTLGHVGGGGRSAYTGSKHAVEGFTKAMALELGPHNIRVNAIAPTFIETPLTAKALGDPAYRADVLAKIALGRVGTPQDVAGAIVFLASDAASLITGASLLIDGGWTAA